ncbi:CRISPR-associated endonuclease Cas2 [Bifidobacterium sp. W8114]|nr:CRISPR-associated endonuclease Cas2 [Bifidobacterium asteroides]MBI0099428.1 CRISPR-associated endonuclease Cas2 [Bifidobacterium sp. W8114]
MMVVVAYDVDTCKAAGRRRLRKVGHECMKFGQRVQNSVFECVVTPVDRELLKQRLMTLINPQEDSLIMYDLGARYSRRIHYYGVRRHIPVDQVMML